MKRWIILLLCLMLSSCATVFKQELRPTDINRASRARLQLLPGIGPATAQRIIEGRPYIKPDDLLNIKGIDRELLERIKPQITTGQR
tara:strand:+ start:344 stop:604 length:261 start_codon:yes stop_codon:yes gene_type:complete